MENFNFIYFACGYRAESTIYYKRKFINNGGDNHVEKR